MVNCVGIFAIAVYLAAFALFTSLGANGKDEPWITLASGLVVVCPLALGAMAVLAGAARRDSTRRSIVVVATIIAVMLVLWHIEYTSVSAMREDVAHLRGHSIAGRESRSRFEPQSRP